MIVTRYILKEVFATLLAVTSILFVIYLSNRFVGYLADAASGELTTDVVLNLLFLKSITSLPLLLPLSLYLAVTIAMGRFYKDNEITALAACGIGLGQIIRSIFVFALIYASLVSFITMVAAPWAQQQTVRIKTQAEASADFVGIASGRFKEIKDYNLVFYAERISSDQKVMQNVFAQRESEGITYVLLAKKAYQNIYNASGERFLVFSDGNRYEGTPGGTDFKVIRFQEHGLQLQLPGVERWRQRRSGKSVAQLLESDDPQDKAEFHWRVAMPISAILLTLIGVLLSRSDPRQGRYAKLFAAILVYIVYSNLLGVGRSWLENRNVPLWLGLWWVHLTMLTGLAFLWVQQMGAKWAWRSLFRRV